MTRGTERQWETTYETVSPVRLGDGQAIEGVYVRRERVNPVDDNGNPKLNDRGQPVDFYQYVVKNDDGDSFAIGGTYQLDQAMEGVAIGSYVRIAYLGQMELKNGQRMNRYRVEVAK